jgi:hypothetical protein
MFQVVCEMQKKDNHAYILYYQITIHFLYIIIIIIVGDRIWVCRCGLTDDVQEIWNFEFSRGDLAGK